MKIISLKAFNSVKIGKTEKTYLTSEDFKMEFYNDMLVKVEDKHGSTVYIPLTNIPYLRFEEEKIEPKKSNSGTPRDTKKKDIKKGRVIRPKVRGSK